MKIIGLLLISGLHYVSQHSAEVIHISAETFVTDLACVHKRLKGGATDLQQQRQTEVRETVLVQKKKQRYSKFTNHRAS